jgi:hypothetical protein
VPHFRHDCHGDVSRGTASAAERATASSRVCRRPSRSLLSHRGRERAIGPAAFRAPDRPGLGLMPTGRGGRIAHRGGGWGGRDETSPSPATPIATALASARTSRKEPTPATAQLSTVRLGHPAIRAPHPRTSRRRNGRVRPVAPNRALSVAPNRGGQHGSEPVQESGRRSATRS